MCGADEHVLKPARAVRAIINERATSVNIHTPMGALTTACLRGKLPKHISFLPLLYFQPHIIQPTSLVTNPTVMFTSETYSPGGGVHIEEANP